MHEMLFVRCAPHADCQRNGRPHHLVHAEAIEYVLRGAKRERAKSRPGAKRVRLPITPEILRRIRRVWQQDETSYDKIMLWGAVCACFFGFLRSGEITVPTLAGYEAGTHLSMADVTVDVPALPQVIRLNIKASKTDPFRQGVSVYLGRTGNTLCPLVAMLSYLAARGTEPGPLFRLKDGRPLTKAAFVTGVRQALLQAGVDAKNYSGHSFRIGAAMHHSSSGRYRGLYDSDLGAVEKQRLPSVCEDSAR